MLCQHERQNYSRLGVVVVGVHVDVPQAQLMQLSNDFLHCVGVLVGQAIQGACTGPRPGHLGVGEVQQSTVASLGDDLVSVCGIQRGVPAAL